MHDCAFGRLFLAESDKGICELQFFDHDHAPLVAALHARYPQATITAQAKSDFSAAMLFQHPPGLRLHLIGTEFQLKVWQALLQIPEGVLVTYSDVAAAAGNARAIRAAASAVAQNRIGYLVPCHRVIRKSGAWGEYGWGAARKRMLIEYEATSARSKTPSGI